MSARVTVTDVSKIIDTELDVAVAINTANLFMAEVFSSTSLSSGFLGQIELYLAAHFLAVADPREEVYWIEDTRVWFEGKTGKGLDRTRYGQMAMSLDIEGKLSNIGKTVARFKVISEYD